MPAEETEEQDEEQDSELLTRFKKSMGEKWAGEMMNALLVAELQAKAGIETEIDMVNHQ